MKIGIIVCELLIRDDTFDLRSRGWQDDLSFALEIVVEEISIKQSLQNSTEVDDPVMSVVFFCVCSVDPVENVECSVGSHEKDVIPRQVLNFPIALQDNELGQDGNGFQVDRKSPEQFHGIEFVEAASDEMGN